MATDAELTYKQFLKHLSFPRSRSCLCHSRVHPRNWIQPPCLTTKPQETSSKTDRLMNRLSYSSPDLSLDTESMMDSTESDENSSSSDPDHENLILMLEDAKQERKIIQDALRKYDSGEKLPEATKLLIRKWLIKEPLKPLPKKCVKDETSMQKEPKLPSKTERKLLGELQRQFMNLSSKEKKQLINEKDVNKQVKYSEIDKHDEFQSRKLVPKKDRNKNSASTCYQYAVLKRKYEDLRHYLSKTEVENKLLKKENKALHCACEEYGSIAEFKEKISHLESEVSKLKSYVSKCEEELYYHRSKNEKHKVESQRQEEHKESELPLERELSLLKNLNETKIFYEKAIDGYKKELGASKQIIKELQEQQVNFVNQWETKETLMLENFEKQINDLKGKLSAKLSKPDDSENRKHLIKLEKLLSEKQAEIRTLQRQFKDLKSSKCKPESFEKQVLEHFEELLNQAGGGFSTTDKAALLDSVKETVNLCFHDLKQSGQLVNNNIESDKKLKLEYEKLSELLKEKTLEAQAAKHELKKNKEKLQHLYASLEAKGKDEAGLSEGLDALKQLPEMLKSAEAKLSESEEMQRKLAIENRLLTERLERSQSEVSDKQEQIKLFEERISKQNDIIKNLEKDVEKADAKIENLQKLVERKDEILERNSTQLEERIRACASLNSQIEKLKENHNEELRELRTQSQTQDFHCHSKLLELQTDKAKLEGDYAALKSDRSNLEKTFKRQIKVLEDEIETLNFKNKTYQRQLETISSTYKSLFSSTGETS